jgi:purine nucleoside permease
MPETIVALTYNSGAIPLTLAPEDVEEFNALPRLPREIPDDFEPPSVIVTDLVTGRTYWMTRSLCGLACDCRAYVEDITEGWAAFAAKEEATGG